jgi:hypothetical protein
MKVTALVLINISATTWISKMCYFNNETVQFDPILATWVQPATIAAGAWEPVLMFKKSELKCSHYCN